MGISSSTPKGATLQMTSNRSQLSGLCVCITRLPSGSLWNLKSVKLLARINSYSRLLIARNCVTTRTRDGSHQSTTQYTWVVLLFFRVSTRYNTWAILSISQRYTSQYSGSLWIPSYHILKVIIYSPRLRHT